MKQLLVAFLVLTGLSKAQCYLNFESGTFSGWTITDGSPSLSNSTTLFKTTDPSSRKNN